jgi:hypothetical protein
MMPGSSSVQVNIGKTASDYSIRIVSADQEVSLATGCAGLNNL